LQTDHDKILERKLTSNYPDETLRSDVIHILEKYGRDSSAKEVARVRLAILKLAGTDIEKISEYTQAARMDYRDVLARAEYPAQVNAKTWALRPEEKDRTMRHQL